MLEEKYNIKDTFKSLNIDIYGVRSKYVCQNLMWEIKCDERLDFFIFMCSTDPERGKHVKLYVRGFLSKSARPKWSSKAFFQTLKKTR